MSPPEPFEPAAGSMGGNGMWVTWETAYWAGTAEALLRVAALLHLPVASLLHGLSVLYRVATGDL